jgi:hypothetical protein
MLLRRFHPNVMPTTRVRCIRCLATESKAAFCPPPPPPDRKLQIMRALVTGGMPCSTSDQRHNADTSLCLKR